MTAFVLKIIASACMLIDHIGAVFPQNTPYFFRSIGRISFPVYAYMAAYGCIYTKNIYKYILRLGIFAIISQIPFTIAFYGLNEPVYRISNFLYNTNVFYTLFLGVSCVAVYERLKVKERQWVMIPAIVFAAAVILVAQLSIITADKSIINILLAAYVALALCLSKFFPEGRELEAISFNRTVIPFFAVVPLIACAAFYKTDYSAFGAAFIFALYIANANNKGAVNAVLLAGMTYLYGRGVIVLLSDGQAVTPNISIFGVLNLLFSLFAVFLIDLYNGEQGPRFKWAFYAFYPAHITILAVAKYF